MDTSESEDYYESADEDFELDNKSKKSHAVSNVNNTIDLADAHENLITSRVDERESNKQSEGVHRINRNETDKKVNASELDHENNSLIIKKVKETSVIKSNQKSLSPVENKCTQPKSIDIYETKDSLSSDVDKSSADDKFSEKENIQSKIKDSSQRKDESNNSKIAQCDRNKFASRIDTNAFEISVAPDCVDKINRRPEFRISSTKVECSEAGVNNRPDVGMPSAKVEYTEPGTNSSRDIKGNKIQNMIDHEAQGDKWDDNWQWEEEKLKEDNLWADEEGWGLDEDLECIETNIKQVDSSTRHHRNKLPESIEKVEDDLWGREDNWGNDDSDSKNIGNITESLDKLSIKGSSDNSGWGGWGNWGITSVLSTAANLTSTVSQGFTNVLETGMGVPNPEDLARQHLEENNKIKSINIEATDGDKIAPVFGLENFVSKVSTITKLVESTSTKVISGGLDTLETIGKKTIQVLQENDPGLKKKCAFLKIDHNKPVLSQLLREAKEKAEEENKERERQHFEKKANYETIFDDHQGLVHLEALEMLSKQCDIKLEMIISKTTDSDSLKDLQETLSQVRELCELPDDDESEQDIDVDQVTERIENALADINVPITYDKLIDLWKATLNWIDTLNFMDNTENSIHQNAIETLAKLTAIAVEQFHKAGELLLIKEHRSTADEADSLVQLTITLSEIIHMTSVKYCEKLKELSCDNGLITNVFLEATNSSTYIKDAFQLLIPVLLVGAV